MVTSLSAARPLGVLLALCLVATSCGQLLISNADEPVERQPAPSALAYATSPLLDERIDFTTSRQDVDCSVAGTTVRDDTRVVSAHYVVDGKLGAICSGRTSTVLVDAWKELVSLVPPDQLRQVGIFAGYTNTVSISAENSTIGVASSLGWWAPAAQISIDIDYAFADPVDLRRVLVHEMGHVISLSRTQGVQLRTTQQCLSYEHQGMCFYGESLLFDWIDSFWSNMIADVDPEVRPSQDVGRPRCETNAGFWSPYSASSPTEDFAEFYAAFVLRVEAQSPPQQEKLDWFESKPGLVEARERATQLGHGPSQWRARCG